MKTIPQIFPVDWDEVRSSGLYASLPDDVSGWNSDYSIFDHLVAETEARTAIEVGTWKGRSAIHVAKAMRDGLRFRAEKEGREVEPDEVLSLYCVDTWQGGADHLLSELPQDRIGRENGYPIVHYRQFLTNVLRAGVERIVQPVVCPSSIGAKLLSESGVVADLVYVDGDHTHDGCFADIAAYWPFVRPGGVLFGDDCSTPGVHSAVARFMSAMEIESVGIDGPFWIFRKPA